MIPHMWAKEAVKFRIEKLLESKRTGNALDATTADWLAEIDDVLADRLARAGLASPRQKREATDLGEFLDGYVAKPIDVKPATREIWSQPIRNLKEYFGADRNIATIDAGDCEDFKLFLIGQKLAATTVSKRLQFARMFFRDASSCRGQLSAGGPRPERLAELQPSHTTRATLEESRPEALAPAVPFHAGSAGN